MDVTQIEGKVRPDYKNPSEVEPAAYTLATVAKMVGVSYGTAWEACRAGTFPLKSFKVGRQHRFRKAEVDRFLGITG